MKSYVARLGGVVLFLIALAGGVLIGRVIEAFAVGAVLFAIWTSGARLLSTPDDPVPGRGDSRS